MDLTAAKSWATSAEKTNHGSALVAMSLFCRLRRVISMWWEWPHLPLLWTLSRAAFVMAR
ncbi:hypothetical protein CY34DRAFT_15651 [Suillus luteus UH-Slu-Lm8-n1]|uniref:Uncharacterized protein n=1 Tax=Suillus luteus UH-Slu-Lm8-n1 TaxID=930992 RepID=A0A0D0AHD0_9AGAM|nr:hypothetical protein CY34DRAFT_15651 [Suillus luteus UH-Slu-Lm8-n1]